MFTTATWENIFNPIRQIQVSDGHHASTRSQKWDVTTLFHSLLTKLAFLESCSVNSPWPRRSPHRDNSTITHRSMYPHTRDASVLRGLYKPVRRETVAMRALMGACPLRVRGAGPRTHAQSRTCFIYCLAIYFILLQNVC